MLQKITENFPILIGLIVVIFALYSCAFRRMCQERKDRDNTVKEQLISGDTAELRDHRG